MGLISQRVRFAWPCLALPLPLPCTVPGLPPRNTVLPPPPLHRDLAHVRIKLVLFGINTSRGRRGGEPSRRWMKFEAEKEKKRIA